MTPTERLHTASAHASACLWAADHEQWHGDHAEADRLYAAYDAAERDVARLVAEMDAREVGA